jgi:hypothetical protein
MQCSHFRRALLASAIVSVAGLAAQAQAQTINYFAAGDIVVSSVSNQTSPGDAAYTANAAAGGGLDTASPITLTEFNTGAGGVNLTTAGTLVLPQTASGSNNPISGEYGSASEGILQLSGNGQYLTIMGYDINANTFNSAVDNGTATTTYGTTALGQTNSLTGQSVATVARDVALIGTNGSVDTSTAVTGVFDMNNPRSAATQDGSSFYISGQGSDTGSGASKIYDGTGGVFYVTKGSSTATPINTSPVDTTFTNGSDPLIGSETRTVEIVNTGSGPQLYVSRDFAPPGTPNDQSDIRLLTNSSGGLPTSSVGLQATRLFNNNTSSGKGGNTLGGNTSSINLTSSLDNTVNSSRNGKFVYLSPEQFYFANSTTLYVADSGEPKNGSANAAAIGEGGLQKWSLISGVWTLDYDISLGLNLVNNASANSATPSAPGVTGLFGLACNTVGNTVQCYATSYGLNELSPSYLYEVTDSLSNTSATVGDAETFTTVSTAPIGTDYRGVSFAPVPEPVSLSLFGAGAAALALVRRRRRA